MMAGPGGSPPSARRPMPTLPTGSSPLEVKPRKSPFQVKPLPTLGDSGPPYLLKAGA